MVILQKMGEMQKPSDSLPVPLSYPLRYRLRIDERKGIKYRTIICGRFSSVEFVGTRPDSPLANRRA